MSSQIRFPSDLPVVGPSYGFIRGNLQALMITLCGICLLVFVCYKAPHYSIDFIPIYTGAQCLIKGCNPYDTAQLTAQYYHAGGLAKYLHSWKETPPVYPPSAFLVASPLTMIRIPMVERLWAAFNGLLLIACVVLVRSMVPPSSRWLVTILGSCYLVARSTLLFVSAGQPGAFAISLLIIGTLLYLRRRYIPLATVLLLLSLAVKPQIGVLIVLYFLFRRIYWRWAALAMAGSIAILLLAGWILGSRPVSAHWISDLRTQITDTEKPGEINDPRPAAMQGHTFVNLQASACVFIADAKGYNAVSYAVFLAAVAVWITAATRKRSDAAGYWLALAALTAVSMLPIYHRDHDTRLLILALPAIAIIFRQRRIFGSMVIALSLLQIFGYDLQHRINVFFLRTHVAAQSLLQNKLLYLVFMRQESLVVLVLAGCFLAAMFVLRVPTESESSVNERLTEAQGPRLVDQPA